MRDVDPAARARLMASFDRLRTTMVLTLVGVLAVGVFLWFYLPVGGTGVVLAGSALGLLIGRVLTTPHRRTVREMGLTEQEARQVVAEERDRRSPLAVLSPEQRVERLRRRRSIWLAVGVVALAVLVIGAGYVIAVGGETVQEGDSAAPIGTAFFSAFGGFVLSIYAFVSAKVLRDRIRAESSG